MGQCYLYQAGECGTARGWGEYVNEASKSRPPQGAGHADGGQSHSTVRPTPLAPAGIELPSVIRPKRVPTECGDLPFVIRRDASWLYRGTPINRKELVCLFASVLKREPDGSFWLETPAERGRIEVVDAPFLAVELDWKGDGANQVLSFRSNVDEIFTAGPEHPIRVSMDIMTCEPTPYIIVRPGKGRWPIEARIGRAVYYELVALAVPREIDGRQVLGVWSSGSFFVLGELPPEDAEC